MKIYTRKGDRGETGLLGKKRISKASLRIEAYGTVDELIAALGVAASQLKDPSIGKSIERLQSALHLVCAELATPDLKRDAYRISEKHVEVLEKHCDELEAKLPALKNFILPGGVPAGAQLHFTRTVARRAERRVVELAEQEAINPEVIRYLNRLSDLLFLIAAWVNHKAGVSERHPDYR